MPAARRDHRVERVVDQLVPVSGEVIDETTFAAGVANGGEFHA
jgi:hypothetical protein